MNCINYNTCIQVILVQTKYQREFIKLGLKVQYYRKLLGLTQEAFADKAGISWSHLCKD